MVVGFRVLRQSFCGKFEFSADFSVQLIQFFGCMVLSYIERDPLRKGQLPEGLPDVARFGGLRSKVIWCLTSRLRRSRLLHLIVEDPDGVTTWNAKNWIFLNLLDILAFLWHKKTFPINPVFPVKYILIKLALAHYIVYDIAVWRSHRTGFWINHQISQADSI